MYDRIVVPLADPRSSTLLPPAIGLARSLGCDLTLLHIHSCTEAPAELEDLPQYRYQHVVERWDERDAEAEQGEAEWLRILAEQVAEEEPGLVVSHRVVHAPLVASLRTGDERVLAIASVEPTDDDGLGLPVHEILTAGGVPVLLVEPGAELKGIRRVLVAMDGSHFSQEILAPAIDLALALDARVSLLEVVTRYSGLVRLLHPAERTAESAERFLNDMWRRVPSALGPVKTRVVEHPDAAAGIVAEAGPDDVIAMATHGRGGLRRLLLGSVAESVVRSRRGSVLLFRPAGASSADRPVAHAATGSATA